MLGYCDELGVPLEVEVNSSRGALMQCDKLNGGAPVTERRAVNDTRGHVSELLAKCIKKGALDEEITAEDRERMIEFPPQYGDLNPTCLSKAPSALASRFLLARAKKCPRPSTRSPCTPSSTPICGKACSPKKSLTGSPPCSSPSAAWIASPTPFTKHSAPSFATAP
jgi:hypothetical protein